MEEGSQSQKSEDDDCNLENFLDFTELKEDLEGYRQREMTSFQKINHFLMNIISDNVYYYIDGKKPYSLDYAFEKSASRDFLHR